MNSLHLPRLESLRWLVCGCFTIFLLSALAGCNSGQLPTHPVEGRVVFEDGSHPKFGSIEFYSVDHQINAQGKIDRDGTFTVGTYEDQDGAVAGKHQVIIQQITGNYLTEKMSDQIHHDHGELLDPAFFDYRTSGLECTIDPGQNKVEFMVRKNPRQSPEGMPTN